MSKIDAAVTGQQHYPRVYRERYWGAAFSALFTALLILIQAGGFDPLTIFSVAALLLFAVLQLVTTRIILYGDRIESVALTGRRSMDRNDIERVEFRETKVKGKIVKSCFLISKAEPECPMSVPIKLVLDELWFDWMEGIPEAKIPPLESVASGSLTLIVLLLVGGFTASLIIPIMNPQLKPYFDLFYLVAPWLVVFCLITPSVRGALSSRIPDGTAPAILVGSLAILIAPIYLIVTWRSNNTYIIARDSLPFVGASIMVPILMLLLLRTASSFALNLKRETLFLMVAAMGIYGYGVALTINSRFGGSDFQTAPVRIQSKYVVTSGKSRGPYFTLAPWGDEPIVRTFRPSQTVYDRRMVGDRLCASLYRGALGVRWYSVKEDCP